MVSSRLLKLRLAKGLKQKEVAEVIGVSERAYCSYEIGTRDPATSTVVKLAGLYDVSTDYLLGVSDVPQRSSKSETNFQGILAKIFFEISDETKAEFVELLQSYIDEQGIFVCEPTDDDRAEAKALEKKFKYKLDDESKSKV